MKLEYNESLRTLAAPHQGSSTPVFRVIDRRLQALRKKGMLRFNGKAWVRLNLDGAEA
jgi:hypothetical protein